MRNGAGGCLTTRGLCEVLVASPTGVGWTGGSVGRHRPGSSVGVSRTAVDEREEVDRCVALIWGERLAEGRKVGEGGVDSYGQSQLARDRVDLMSKCLPRLIGRE